MGISSLKVSKWFQWGVESERKESGVKSPEALQQCRRKWAKAGRSNQSGRRKTRHPLTFLVRDLRKYLLEAGHGGALL